MMRPEEFLGKRIVVQNPTTDARWEGTAIGFADHPTVVLLEDSGRRMTLPAAWVTLAEPDVRAGDRITLERENGDRLASRLVEAVPQGGGVVSLLVLDTMPENVAHMRGSYLGRLLAMGWTVTRVERDS